MAVRHFGVAMMVPLVPSSGAACHCPAYGCETAMSLLASRWRTALSPTCGDAMARASLRCSDSSSRPQRWWLLTAESCPIFGTLDLLVMSNSSTAGANAEPVGSEGGW